MEGRGRGAVSALFLSFFILSFVFFISITLEPDFASSSLSFSLFLSFFLFLSLSFFS